MLRRVIDLVTRKELVNVAEVLKFVLNPLVDRFAVFSGPFGFDNGPRNVTKCLMIDASWMTVQFNRYRANAFSDKIAVVGCDDYPS